MGEFKIERTGEVFGYASSQFRVTYPDGFVGTLWSPHWHELTDEQEQAEALEIAKKVFAEGKHREKFSASLN